MNTTTINKGDLLYSNISFLYYVANADRAYCLEKGDIFVVIDYKAPKHYYNNVVIALLHGEKIGIASLSLNEILNHLIKV